MSEEVRIWVIGDASDQVASVESTNRTDTEQILEDAVVKSPEMLLPGLTLVGRQIPTEAGYPDLLGIDESGRLVVFELKRGVLTRQAVAQVLDYGSFLTRLSTDDLVELIATQPDAEGIEAFRDREAFEEWYNEHKAPSLEDLLPPRMVLVGIGVDESAARIVDFLQDGLDISLLTFHGFNHKGETLLARQVEGGEPRGAQRGAFDTRDPRNRQELYASLRSRAIDRGVEDLWADATRALKTQDDEYPKRSGITFRSLKPLELPELIGYRTVRASHSVDLDASGQVRITFFPAAIALCQKAFIEAKNTIPFQSEVPPNAPTTASVQEQLFVLLDSDLWATHKNALIGLAEKVARQWRRN